MTIHNGHETHIPHALARDLFGDPRIDADTVAQVRRAVADRLHDAHTTSTAALTEVVGEEVSAWVRQRAAHGIPPPSTADERRLAHEVLAALSGLGGLEIIAE